MTNNNHFSLIEVEFPLQEISEACKKEKSIRQGHISTLQQWWARRPLAICRSAIFAALAPTSDVISSDSELLNDLEEFVTPSDNTTHLKLKEFIARLSEWDSSNNERLLSVARKIIMKGRVEKPYIVDTFAGGGSFPIEAIRLGLDAFAGELNPVASTALRVAIEYLPASEGRISAKYRVAARNIERRIREKLTRIYSVGGETVLAFFWAHTYTCPFCEFEVPLLRDRWLAKGEKCIAVELHPNEQKKVMEFEICRPSTSDEKIKASQGTVNQKGAICSNCGKKVSTSWMRNEGIHGRIGDLLYAKLILDTDGHRVYMITGEEDRDLANMCKLRDIDDRSLIEVPSQEFDLNGIRHTWMIQYGIRSTSDLYSHRQKIALLEVAHEINTEKQKLLVDGNSNENIGTITSLILTFNRLVSYGNKHVWWQSNGEFPASIFTRQAIPMVWNYVEIPVCSQGAAGWKSASIWLEKVIENLSNLPQKGVVYQGDAAKVPFESERADLVTIDPPYFDSIAYSYLADVYFVWMRSFLKDIFPNDFTDLVSPKKEEAIVDRKHKMAPSPKNKKHFYRKMREAFLEIHRILKPNGRLLIMYGHKKAEAWDALLSALLSAGFIPTVSWPINTERKNKFRHSRIDYLSSSVLLVCVPYKGIDKKKRINVELFEQELEREIAELLKKFQEANFLGPDLFTSLIAPAFKLLCEYDVEVYKNKLLEPGELLIRLPDIVAKVEMDILLDRAMVRKNIELKNIIERLVQSGEKWTNLASSNSIAQLAIEHSKNLHNGNVDAADRIWNSLLPQMKEELSCFLRAAAAISQEGSIERKLANASIGRISHQNNIQSTGQNQQ